MIRTTKNDWLNQAMADRGILVSGHSSFSSILNLNPQTHHCALRFIHRGDTLLIFLTIETSSIKSFDQNALNTKVLNQLKAIFGDSLFILTFDETETFLLADGNELTFRQYNSTELEQYFGGIDNNLVQNKGTFKQINKSTNDSFLLLDSYVSPSLSP